MLFLSSLHEDVDSTLPASLGSRAEKFLLGVYSRGRCMMLELLRLRVIRRFRLCKSIFVYTMFLVSQMTSSCARCSMSALSSSHLHPAAGSLKHNLCEEMQHMDSNQDSHMFDAAIRVGVLLAENRLMFSNRSGRSAACPCFRAQAPVCELDTNHTSHTSPETEHYTPEPSTLQGPKSASI